MKMWKRKKNINEKLSNLRLHKLIQRIELIIYYGTSMLLVYIHLLCGMKKVFTQGLRPVMLLQEI